MFERINISKSGANPDKKPIRPIIPSDFFLLIDCERVAPKAPCVSGSNFFYSHSIVAGGFPEISYTTRLIPLISLMIRFEI